MLFLVYQFAGEFQSRAHVFDGQFVLALHFLETHPARKAAHDDGHRSARATDHRLAVADTRIDDDSIIQHMRIVGAASEVCKSQWSGGRLQLKLQA